MVRLVQRLQHLLGDDFRQIRQQVREIVEIHARGCGDEFLGLHALHQAVADLIAQFDENVALIVGCNHFPEQGAFLQGQGFEQARNLGRPQAVHHEFGGPQAAAVELFAQQLQVALGMLSRFHGSCPELQTGTGMGPHTAGV